jgi:putative tricarboxylic transport membrane protein
VGSFIAGTLGALMLSLVGPSLAKYALKFGPPEYTGLLFLSLTAVISLSGTSLTKGLGAGLVGIIVATVGADPMTGLTRFHFGSTNLMRGFDIVPLTVGLFGIGEILLNLEMGTEKVLNEGAKIGKMMPRGAELRKGIKASLRGSLLGLPLGVLPGMVPALSSFLAYDLEKKVSKYPEEFGKGMIEGVAGPESANNATAQSGFLPLMCLGIPTGPSMAIILAALIMYGLQPGPVLFQNNKPFVWAVIGSMYIGNIMLLILNLPLVGMWARISLIPYKYLAPTILGICVVGAYSPRNTMFDVWIALGAGILGYAMRKRNWPLGPLILGIILGPMFEQSLRQSMSMGGPSIFFNRPIAIVLFILAIALLVISLKLLKRVPKEIIEDDSDT